MIPSSAGQNSATSESNGGRQEQLCSYGRRFSSAQLSEADS